jgi:hypothetical protein
MEADDWVSTLVKKSVVYHTKLNMMYNGMVPRSRELQASDVSAPANRCGSCAASNVLDNDDPVHPYRLCLRTHMSLLMIDGKSM